MKIKTKIISIRKIEKIVLPAIALLSVLIFLPAYKSLALEQGWGPERPTYKWAEPAPHRTFNSITDNPSLGDERNFVRVREAGVGTYKDEVTLEIGKEYEVYIYYHNNASASLNDSGAGVAANVRLSTNMPYELHAGEIGQVTATISSSNTTPSSVWDSAYLRANDTVYLRYVQGSAKIFNGGSSNGKNLNGENLFSDEGDYLAYSDSYWGLVPGCNEYAGYVTYRVAVDQPKFFVTKEASKDAKNEWGTTIEAKPGEKIDFKITYKNTGTTEQKSVSVYDNLPNGMKYLDGTTFIINGSNPNGIFLPDKLFNEGLNIGDYRAGLGAGSQAVITYKLEVLDDENLFPCNVTREMFNNVQVATANGTMMDSVRIVVTRDCEGNPPTELPKTGPGDVALAIIALLGITVGGTYWYRSRKVLKEVEAVTGGKGVEKE